MNYVIWHWVQQRTHCPLCHLVQYCQGRKLYISVQPNRTQGVVHLQGKCANLIAKSTSFCHHQLLLWVCTAIENWIMSNRISPLSHYNALVQPTLLDDDQFFVFANFFLWRCIATENYDSCLLQELHHIASRWQTAYLSQQQVFSCPFTHWPLLIFCLQLSL